MPTGIYKHKALSEKTKMKIGEGNRGKKRSIGTKKKISEARKGIKLSEEHKKKISEALIGHISAMLGKKHSEEAKRKMSEANKGKKHSEEARQKISKKLKGIKRSKETRQKISQALKRRFAQMTRGEKSNYLLPATKAAQTLESRQKASITLKENWDRMTKEEKRERTKLWGVAGQKVCHSLKARQKMGKTQKIRLAKMTEKEKMKILEPWIKAGRTNPSSIEKAIWEVLDKLGINYETQVSFNYSKFIVDIYVPAQRLIIECNGDYWHNLPDRKRRDKKLKKYTKNNSYNLIELWERDIRRNPEQALQNGLKFMKKRNKIKQLKEEMKKHA